MFDSRLFKDLCNKVKKEEMFNGKKVQSKEQLYEIIAELCCTTPEQVKKWTFPNSRGPRDIRVLEKLEEIFGVEFVERTGKYPVKKCSEFTQKAILDIYRITCDLFSKVETEGEEIWWKIIDTMEKSRLVIPCVEYENLEKYLRDNLEDMIFNEEKVFPELFSEEYGMYNDEGDFCIHYEKNDEFLRKYFELLRKKENEFEEYMIKNFAAYF